MPIVSEVSTSLASKGVVAYAVNVGEDRDTASNFFKKIGLTLPLLVDADGSIAESYGAIAIPQTVLIDRDGRIQAVHVGIDRPEAFREKLRKQLNALVNGENLVGEAEESGSKEK
jgi:peroxiredoxin